MNKGKHGETKTIDGRDFIWVDGNLLSVDDIHNSFRLTHRVNEAFQEYIHIKLQKGPINEVGVNGCGIEDVIQFCIDQLRMWNEGDMRCRENSLAITSLEESQNWLVRRHINRIQQGVEGFMAPHVPEGGES